VTEHATDRRADESERAQQDIENAEEAAVDSGTARLFDVRRVIGGLFAFYGILLVVYGVFFATSGDDRKSLGVDINLWTGLGMLVVAVVFLTWAFLRPLALEPAEEDEGQGAREPSQDGAAASARLGHA
jgi:hypothetical protein